MIYSLTPVQKRDITINGAKNTIKMLCSLIGSFGLCIGIALFSVSSFVQKSSAHVVVDALMSHLSTVFLAFLVLWIICFTVVIVFFEMTKLDFLILRTLVWSRAIKSITQGDLVSFETGEEKTPFKPS